MSQHYYKCKTRDLTNCVEVILKWIKSAEERTAELKEFGIPTDTPLDKLEGSKLNGDWYVEVDGEKKSLSEALDAMIEYEMNSIDTAINNQERLTERKDLLDEAFNHVMSKDLNGCKNALENFLLVE